MSVLEPIFRAAYLGALTLAPTLLSPEPSAVGPAVEALALAALAAPIALAAWLRRAAETLEATAAAALWIVTAIVLVLVARSHDGASAPLLRGYYVAAPFVWISLATTAAAAAGHFLGSSWKNKRVGAAVVVLAGGIFLFRSGHELVASPQAMWEAVLARDPADPRAFAALFTNTTKLDRAELARAAQACLEKDKSACGCLVARADGSLSRGDAPRALVDAKSAFAASCPLTTTVAGAELRDVLAFSAAKTSDVETAQRALEGAPDEPRPRLLLARAMVAQSKGDPAVAESLARRALAVPGSTERDAKLLLASLLIGRSESGEARGLLVALTKADPHDADATYDLALVDDLAGNYNAAREGYLRALRDDPEYRSARYNLAVLTMRQGILPEARHHALKFVESWPDDPRGAELVRLTGAVPGAK